VHHRLQRKNELAAANFRCCVLW